MNVTSNKSNCSDGDALGHFHLPVTPFIVSAQVGVQQAESQTNINSFNDPQIDQKNKFGW